MKTETPHWSALLADIAQKTYRHAQLIAQGVQNDSALNIAYGDGTAEYVNQQLKEIEGRVVRTPDDGC